jgi:hypothetical protein
MLWNVWSSIVEDAGRTCPDDYPEESEWILEVCGHDCKGHFFIETTSAIPHGDGIRKFMLTAAVDLDGIVLIRPAEKKPSAANKGASSLFQICQLERRGAIRIVHVRPFDPLPDWPRHQRSKKLNGD